VKNGAALISASVYQDERGNKVYWALWVPKKNAHLLAEQMERLGIGQAKIEATLSDRLAPLGAVAGGFVAVCGLIWTGLIFLDDVIFIRRKAARFVKKT
jgi:hypothetical protein